MIRKIFLVAAVLACAAPAVAAQEPAPEAAPEPRFSGTTVAETPAIRASALGELTYFSNRSLQCSTATEVSVATRPQGWVPADPNFRIGPAGTVYERWDVTLCGRVVPFLVAFWREPSGQQFAVGHPYPGDQGAPAS